MRLLARASLLLFAAAGGCSNNGLGVPGGDGATAADQGVPDMAAPADAATAPADLIAPADLTAFATGSRLVQGNFSLQGVTSDDYAIYTDDKSGALAAESASGGSPISISGTAGQLLISGKAVLVWSNVDMNTNVGQLSVWTKANGTHTLDAASLLGEVAVSDDGGTVLYCGNTTVTTIMGTSAPSACDIVLVKSDGTGAKTIYTQVPLPTMQGQNSDCVPTLGFAGGLFVTNHCLGMGDAAATTATLSTIDPSSGATNDVRATGASNIWQTDKAGDKLLIVGDAADLTVVPIAGGTAVSIDSNVASGFLTSDGATAIYLTNDGSLKVSPTGSPSPKTLATGIDVMSAGIQAISPDEKWILYSVGAGVVNGTSDLWIVPVAGGTPAALASKKTAAVFGSAFTRDSSRALFYTAVTANGIGTFESAGVNQGGGGPDGGVAATVHGTKAWIDYATYGTHVAFNPNFQMVANKNGRADLIHIDTATNKDAVEIAAQADVDFYLTSDRRSIFYTSTMPGLAGLYLVPVPGAPAPSPDMAMPIVDMAVGGG